MLILKKKLINENVKFSQLPSPVPKGYHSWQFGVYHFRPFPYTYKNIWAHKYTFINGYIFSVKKIITRSIVFQLAFFSKR